MSKLVISLRTIGYYILGLLFSISLIIFVFLPILLPLLLLWVVAILTAKFMPSLGRPLSPQSAIFARDDLYGKPGHSLALSVGYNGNLSKSQVEKRFKEVIEADQFPELKQYLSRWMGFYFWEQDKNFSLEEHLTYCEDEIKTFEELDEKRCALVDKPFVMGKSLWEAVFYPNCKIEGSSIKTISIIRIHHTMADGYSILKIANAMTDDKNLFQYLAVPKSPKRGFIARIWFVFRLFVRGPVDVVRAIRESGKEQNEWKASQNRMLGYGHRATSDVPLAKVVEIGTKHGVRTTAVLFAALAGGVRKHMELCGTEIPESFTLMYFLPLPSHPDYLTNSM
jgi:hypothetical protein